MIYKGDLPFIATLPFTPPPCFRRKSIISIDHEPLKRLICGIVIASKCILQHTAFLYVVLYAYILTLFDTGALLTNVCVQYSNITVQSNTQSLMNLLKKHVKIGHYWNTRYECLFPRRIITKLSNYFSEKNIK